MLTKKVVIRNDETNEDLKSIYNASLKETKISADGRVYSYTSEDSEYTKSMNHWATAGAAHLTGRYRELNLDAAGKYSFPLQKTDMMIPIEVLQYEAEEDSMFKIAMVYTLKDKFVWIDTIGDKLLLCKDDGTSNTTGTFKNTFLLELKQGLHISNYTVSL